MVWMVVWPAARFHPWMVTPSGVQKLIGVFLSAPPFGFTLRASSSSCQPWTDTTPAGSTAATSAFTSKDRASVTSAAVISSSSPVARLKREKGQIRLPFL